jgi:aspartate/methionine/tyrosine aminotransferase
VQTYVEQDFQVTVEDLERARNNKTKAVLLGYPNNPTGAVLERERLVEIARWAEEHDLLVVSDEIYDRLVYGIQHTCFAALDGMRDRTILLGGFSKSYAMTGWRIGYAAAPPPLLSAMLDTWESWWRDIAVVGAPAPELVTNSDQSKALSSSAKRVGVHQAAKALELIDETRLQLQENVNPRLAFEALTIGLP